ncbi:MAG: winged helix-turn-helix domain-containing protein [Prevotella sp.]
MAEKKTTKKETAVKTTATKKATTTKRTCGTAKKTVLELSAENAGFKAGDVYQALAASEGAMTVSEIAKASKISEAEVLLGAGWLFKEGKIVSVEGKVTLA